MKSHKSNTGSVKKIILLALGLLLISALIALAYIAQNHSLQNEHIENAGVAEHGIQTVKEISYRGETQRLRHNVDTLLIIGIDSEDIIERYKDTLFVPYYNFQQADFLCLMVFDNNDNTIQLIQINRDTMNYNPWLGVMGDVGGYVYEQIALSHNSGCGLEDSCINTCNAVSGLLFGTPIDHYVKISMGAVPVLNDIVGGVPVTIVDDLTSISPEFKRGATVTLMGRDALSYVRARKGVSDGTNISRMRRHRTYINSYITQAKTAFANNLELVAETIIQLDKYMLTDMSFEVLSSVASKISTYQRKDTYVPYGKNIVNNDLFEYHLDKDLLWKRMKEIVC